MPSIYQLETRENFVENMKSADSVLAIHILKLSRINNYFKDERAKEFSLQLMKANPDIATSIIKISIFNKFLDEEFALQLIEENPDCYGLDAGKKWEDLKKKRNIALFAVQQEKSNLDFVPEELKDEDFLVEAFSQNESLLDEHVPHWRTEPRLIRRIYELNPDILNEIDSTLYEDVSDVNTAFPTWKTDLKLIKHILLFNPELFNEVDPSMYNNPELFEFIRKNKIPLTVLNKPILQQTQLKGRMSDLRTLALSQKYPENLGSNTKGRETRSLPIGLDAAYNIKSYLGGSRSRKRKTKRRTYGSAP
jgi:hypothetical protein